LVITDEYIFVDNYRDLVLGSPAPPLIPLSALPFSSSFGSSSSFFFSPVSNESIRHIFVKFNAYFTHIFIDGLLSIEFIDGFYIKWSIPKKLVGILAYNLPTKFIDKLLKKSIINNLVTDTNILQ